MSRLILLQDLRDEREKHAGATEFFHAIKDSSERFVLRWLKLAKTKKTRKARILELAELSARGEKLNPEYALELLFRA
ncbi:YdeI/OmpD-associated family protein [Algoriphagus boritolerans]|uniref:YdeI/OmpD-associated family protein n=1 Tax=Algoriphagus boritolerans TaxID=308111 RepID=UPI001F27434B|nr:YdeI/OmpD-associated family protein [Algoriphagus boritolerans]